MVLRMDVLYRILKSLRLHQQAYVFQYVLLIMQRFLLDLDLVLVGM